MRARERDAVENDRRAGARLAACMAATMSNGGGRFGSELDVLSYIGMAKQAIIRTGLLFFGRDSR